MDLPGWARNRGLQAAVAGVAALTLGAGITAAVLPDSAPETTVETGNDGIALPDSSSATPTVKLNTSSPSSRPTPKATTRRPTPKATKSTTRPPSRKPTTSKPTTPSGMSGLTDKMRSRVTLAFAAADDAGVDIVLNSGWRSIAEQTRLWREAVEKYGSEEEARRWVLPPDESAHPDGKAVDIGPPSGAAWLGKNGYKYGLCQRYSNEPWHFEALTSVGGKCPTPEDGAEG